MDKPCVVHLTTVHSSFDPRIYWKEAVSLAKAGYSVCLVAQHTKPETVAGVRIIPLTSVQGRYRRLLLQREVFHTARDLNAAIYHFHDPELIPVAYALKRATGARIIYDMHENYRWHGAVEGRLIRAMERWCFRWIDHVILAEESYDSIVPIQTPRTFILNYFRPLETPGSAVSRQVDNSLCLLYAGVVSGERGLFHMLDLAKVILEEKLPWDIILAGVCYRVRDRQLAERRIKDEKLEPVIRRLGWQSYILWSTMDPYFRSADVGLALFEAHPNERSSILTKFYEYLHYGLPILCSDFPLWRAFIEKHGCGAVVDPSDQEGVLRILKQWSADHSLYRALSEAALDAAPNYRWEIMEERLLRLYEQLLAA